MKTGPRQMKHDALKTEDRTTILAHPDALYLHPSNPRQDAPEADIAALADSIAACGLLQNLCGVMDEDGTRIGVVAGGRRMRAVARLAKEGRGDGPYPVLIAPDAETALRWAQVENAARAALHPADEIGSYAKMAEQGPAPRQSSWKRLSDSMRAYRYRATAWRFRAIRSWAF